MVHVALNVMGYSGGRQVFAGCLSQAYGSFLLGILRRFLLPPSPPPRLQVPCELSTDLDRRLINDLFLNVKYLAFFPFFFKCATY